MTDDSPSSSSSSQPANLVDAPEIPEDARTGRYAVYNRTLGQYVHGTMSDTKHTSAQIKDSIPDGHVGVVVQV